MRAIYSTLQSLYFLLQKIQGFEGLACKGAGLQVCVYTGESPCSIIGNGLGERSHAVGPELVTTHTDEEDNITAFHVVET